MRGALATLLIILGACSPTPSPSAPPMTPVPSVPPTATRSPVLPTQRPTASPIAFRFDVQNRSTVAVVVSVVSDTAGVMPGFLPGQQGTISIPLLHRDNGISVEIQGDACRLLASALYPTPVPFTLLVEDGPGAGTVQLSTRPGIAATPIPLPSNALQGCGG